MPLDPSDLPDALRERLAHHPHVDWDAVAVEALERQLEALEDEDALTRELDDPTVRWASEVLREEALGILREVADARRG